MKRQWFRWTRGKFEHTINLAMVSQWLYHPAPGEHAFVWLGGCLEHVTFEDERARDFRKAMLKYQARRAR